MKLVEKKKNKILDIKVPLKKSKKHSKTFFYEAIKNIVSPRKKYSHLVKKKFLASEEFYLYRCYDDETTSHVDTEWFSLWKKKYLFVSRKEIRKKTRLFSLKKKLKCNLHVNFFKPWKYEIPFLTKKQEWLQHQYNKFRELSFKHRVDFFQTQLGQMMLTSTFTIPKFKTWVSTWTKKYQADRLMWQQRHLVRKIRKWWADEWLMIEGRSKFAHQSRKTAYTELRTKHQKSWFYENVLRQKRPYSLAKFQLTRLATAFHHFWLQARKEPWVDPLFFKRSALSVFEQRYRKENKFNEKKLKIKYYLQKKNPRLQKRNKLYKRKQKLIDDTWNKKRIRTNKAARIKQIVSKILRPFYGHLTLKQLIKLSKKTRRKICNGMTRNESILRCLENRLDVVVYRFNWAPHILWARRLIWEGSIFVSNITNSETWSIMYSRLKKYAFPLKLRDPKRLYSKTFWNPQGDLAKNKFVCTPQTDVAYLVQPGDLIQCSKGILVNQFKSNSLWFDKPKSLHLLSAISTETQWRWKSHQFANRSFNSWQEQSEHINAALFLFNPQFRDLPLNDRVQKCFLRWIIL